MDGHPPLTHLTEAQRAVALDRFNLLRPHLEEGVPLTQLARAHGIPLRTARRWVHHYRASGLSGLVRQERRDHGAHHFPSELGCVPRRLHRRGDSATF
jgi:putative transposase